MSQNGIINKTTSVGKYLVNDYIRAIKTTPFSFKQSIIDLGNIFAKDMPNFLLKSPELLIYVCFATAIFNWNIWVFGLLIASIISFILAQFFEYLWGGYPLASVALWFICSMLVQYAYYFQSNQDFGNEQKNPEWTHDWRNIRILVITLAFLTIIIPTMYIEGNIRKCKWSIYPMAIFFGLARGISFFQGMRYGLKYLSNKYNIDEQLVRPPFCYAEECNKF